MNKKPLWERKAKEFDVIPFKELFIEEGQHIEVESIFEFHGKAEEVFAFLHLAERYNCTIYFKNEDITVKPEHDFSKSILINMYCYFYNNQKIADDFYRWCKEKAIKE